MMLSPHSRRLATGALIACALSALTGCGERSITSYRIPKEADPAPDAQSPAPPEEAAPAEAPAQAQFIRWTAPATWQAEAAGGMRLAAFAASGAAGSAEVTVVSFPGDGGDNLANVNRWRGQLGLPPVAAPELEALITHVKAPAGDVSLVDLAGTAPEKGETRLLGAWFRGSGRVWFFKMSGPSAAVAAQRASFLDFLATVSAESGPAPASNTNDAPTATPRKAPPTDALHVKADLGASLQWAAPADWTVQTGSSIRRGSYGLAGGAEVAITAFPGDVGGTLANVNRWRGQAGLDPVDLAGLAKVTQVFDSNGLHFTVFDGSDGAQPIVAAQVPWNGGTWFFKLQGSAAGVAAAKPAFLTFLRTVRAP